MGEKKLSPFMVTKAVLEVSPVAILLQALEKDFCS